MKPRRLPLLVLASWVISGCAAGTSSGPRAAAAEAVVIPLQAIGLNAGNVGRATLLPLAAGTSIVLNFTGVPSGATLPVRVYTYIYAGSCDGLPPKAAYSLNETVQVTNPPAGLAYTVRGSFNLSHNSQLTMDALLDGRLSLALRSAPEDGGQVIYCGALRRPVS